MVLRTRVTNIVDSKDVAEIAEDGAFMHGIFLEGARWECGRGEE